MIAHTAVPAAAATAAAGASVLASAAAQGPWDVILSVSAVLGAVLVIGRFFHVGTLFRGVWKLARLAHLQESFLLDWNGEPARDGYEGRPSVPARLARVEQRLTDHKERNAAQVEILQQAVDELRRDRLIVDTARAIITELGHDLEPPRPTETS